MAAARLPAKGSQGSSRGYVGYMNSAGYLGGERVHIASVRHVTMTLTVCLNRDTHAHIRWACDPSLLQLQSPLVLMNDVGKARVIKTVSHEVPAAAYVDIKFVPSHTSTNASDMDGKTVDDVSVLHAVHNTSVSFAPNALKSLTVKAPHATGPGTELVKPGAFMETCFMGNRTVPEVTARTGHCLSNLIGVHTAIPKVTFHGSETASGMANFTLNIAGTPPVPYGAIPAGGRLVTAGTLSDLKQGKGFAVPRYDEPATPVVSADGTPAPAISFRQLSNISPVDPQQQQDSVHTQVQRALSGGHMGGRGGAPAVAARGAGRGNARTLPPRSDSRFPQHRSRKRPDGGMGGAGMDSDTTDSQTADDHTVNSSATEDGAAGRGVDRSTVGGVGANGAMNDADVPERSSRGARKKSPTNTGAREPRRKGGRAGSKSRSGSGGSQGPLSSGAAADSTVSDSSYGYTTGEYTDESDAGFDNAEGVRRGASQRVAKKDKSGSPSGSAPPMPQHDSLGMFSDAGEYQAEYGDLLEDVEDL